MINCIYLRIDEMKQQILCFLKMASKIVKNKKRKRIKSNLIKTLETFKSKKRGKILRIRAKERAKKKTFKRRKLFQNFFFINDFFFFLSYLLYIHCIITHIFGLSSLFYVSSLYLLQRNRDSPSTSLPYFN